MIKVTTLSNGLKVVYEPIESVRSVSIGIWIKNGSVDETGSDVGISHFIEHMMFKGTTTRTAREVADAMAEIGGRINAFTSKEYTCYYAHILDEHLSVAIEILSDMLLRSEFKEEEIEKEKGVVLEEYAMSEDSPEEIVHDQLEDAIFVNTPLANNILGTKETIANFKRDQILEYIKAHYVASDMLISVVGKFDETAIGQSLEEAFASVSQEPSFVKPSYEVKHQRVFRYKEKDIEQIHLCMSFPAIAYTSEKKFILTLLNTIIGGGINSKLFLGIREDKGLTYSIYSYTETFISGGTFNIYAATNPGQLEEVIVTTFEELSKFMAEGIDDKELFKIKQQIKSNMIIGYENMNNRMSTYGKTALLVGASRSQDEIIEGIDKVTPHGIMELANEILQIEKMSLSLVGKLSEINIERIERLCKK